MRWHFVASVPVCTVPESPLPHDFACIYNFCHPQRRGTSFLTYLCASFLKLPSPPYTP